MYVCMYMYGCGFVFCMYVCMYVCTYVSYVCLSDIFCSLGISLFRLKLCVQSEPFVAHMSTVVRAVVDPRVTVTDICEALDKDPPPYLAHTHIYIYIYIYIYI